MREDATQALSASGSGPAKIRALPLGEMQFENDDLESALNEFMRRGHARDASAQKRDSFFHSGRYRRARDS